MLKFSDIERFRDPRRLWQRVVLYSKRFRPLLRWQDAAGFSSEWAVAQSHTLVSEAGAHTLFQLARHARALDGAMAEVGVYRGGSARLLAQVAREAGRTLHLFDTFEGMPETRLSTDLHAAGDFADTSFDAVSRYLRGFENVSFHVGFFPATAAGLEASAFSFVHVDVDIEASVEACCQFFYPRMKAGGVMLFDDYGQASCPGAKKAVDDFFADKPETVLHLATSQALVLRLPS